VPKQKIQKEKPKKTGGVFSGNWGDNAKVSDKL